MLCRLTALCTLICVPTAQAAPIPLESSNGITVTGVSEVKPRLLEVTISTSAISPTATALGNGVRILLPPNYETSGKRYPVMYLLMGTGAWSYKTWTDTPGTLPTVGNSEVIIVTPDPGKNSWYTDWHDQSVAQKWETFHLDQLVPWVDYNLRTIATREGRAIAGYSMGGYGAMHYATDRPDLFGTAASFSGAVDLQDPLIGVVAVGSGAMYGLPPFGAFDGPAAYSANNPLNHLDKLRNTKLFIESAYSGPIDVTKSPLEAVALPLVEGVVAQASHKMHLGLKANVIQHTYINFGAPGKFAYGNCVGGHTVDCMDYQFNWSFAKMLAGMAQANTAMPALRPALQQASASPIIAKIFRRPARAASTAKKNLSKKTSQKKSLKVST